ncbi:MAG: flavin reductase family protein [Planctomycetes bacterium]|nr:flavin reductase family protein [Planctomycetota bacterium]
MSAFSEMAPEDFKISPFEMIGQEWMLIAAEKEGRTNAMTAAWGGFGFMWRRKVAFIVVRPQRFTKQFIDASGTFSLNFFGSGQRELLNYFGTVSGRDEDKIAKSGLSVAHRNGGPYFPEAETVIICKKLYAQAYRGECFVDPQPDLDCYPAKDYHTLYIGEVLSILARQNAANRQET